MVRIGIDPGKNGFICLMYEGIEYSPIPLINKEVDLNSLKHFFDFWKGGDDMHCALEDVHALFGSAAKATFNFGWIFGVLETFLVAYDIPYTKITPKVWQKEMHQGIPEMKLPDKKVFVDDKGKKISNKKAKELQDKGIPVADKIIKGRKDTKAMSLLAAKRLFPNEDLRASERCKIPHDGKVDALLLAEYCKRKF